MPLTDYHVTEFALPDMVDSLLGPTADPVAAGTTLQQLAGQDPAALGLILKRLATAAPRLTDSDPAILGGLLLALQRLAGTGSPEELRSLDSHAIRTIDTHLPSDTPNRFRLLYLLAAARSEASLRVLAQRLASDPPRDSVAVGQILSPLLRHDDWEPAHLFPSLFDSLQHTSVAASALDLANFLTRKGRVGQHPAAPIRQALIGLLGGVTGRLGQFEEDPRTFGSSVEEVQQVLDEAVALAVSLCDALGLIGQDEAAGKLYQAMELKHRRVQAEAAGALARLGVETGRERLIALAEEPPARLRVLAYADELGISERIDPEYRTDQALAEAEMALWLSQPQQMGVPPTRVEVIDQRSQFWPGFEAPVDCFLVRFEYEFGPSHYSNVGITGPVVHAVAADLADLPLDDIYAVYAGWHVEHADIFRVEAAKWNSAQKRLSRPLSDALDRMGFEDIQPDSLGFFLDEHALIARARREGTECIVVTDGSETIELATQGRPRPVEAGDIWNLYLGRKMLRTFNS